jgi:hypothetical protein
VFVTSPGADAERNEVSREDRDVAMIVMNTAAAATA